jgi:hypothetical protein
MTSLQRGAAPGLAIPHEAVSDEPKPHRTGQPLDPRVQALIGEKLRLYYAELLTEPVPARLLDLVDSFIHSRRGQS